MRDHHSVSCTLRVMFSHQVPLSVNDMNIDLASISGHKIYGPKGIGMCRIGATTPPRCYPRPLA